MPLVEAADEQQGEPTTRNERMLHLAATMGAPSSYLYYYYFADHAVAEARAAPRTRAQEILARVDDYWAHYREQAAAESPRPDPERSRGGNMELELAVNVIHALVNDTGEIWPVNVPNSGGAMPGFPEDLVVEVPARVSGAGVEPIPVPALPRHLRGLIEALGEYQAMAAEAAWGGGRRADRDEWDSVAKRLDATQPPPELFEVI